MKKMTAGEIVVSALHAEGVDTVFGLIGSHTYGIYEALRQQNSIRHVTVCHESTATLAADAWSKVSGHTAVCILTAGPGVLNSISGVGQSHFSATPMVHISGAPPTGAIREELHGSDSENYTADIFAPVTKCSLRPHTLDEIPGLLSEAFSIARSGRHGPVHLEIPLDLMDAPAAPASDYVHKPVPDHPCPRTVAQTVFSEISNAERLLFCFDKGVVRSGISARLVKLAERFGACMAVTRDAIGAVPDRHPLYVGVVHDFNFGQAGFDAVAGADRVVCFGFRRETENLSFITKRLRGSLFNFTFEDESGAFDRGYSASLESVVDALEHEVDREVDGEPRHWPQDGSACWALARLSEQRKQIIDRLDRHRNTTPVHFGWALKQLCRRVTEYTTVVLDAGSHEVWGRTVLPVFGPSSQIGSANWATMGYALPGMIGARLAAPENRIIGITGDGCLLMALSDLTTWLDAGGPSVLVVLNDSEYGMIAQTQDNRFGGTCETKLRAINFAALTRTLGGAGFRVETPDQLEDAIERAFSCRKPALIDIVSLGRMDYPEWP